VERWWSGRTRRHGRDAAAAPRASGAGVTGRRRSLPAAWSIAPAILLTAVTAAVLAQTRYVTGPPPAHTGGFGEPTCYACHMESGPNTGEGTLVLRGLDGVYKPGTAHRIAVELTSPQMRRGGFQLAVRFAEGPAAGKQAGTLRAVDEGVAVTTDSTGIQYAHHLETGTELVAPGTARWTLEWTAPPDGAEGDVVVFHIAANAADDDASPFGDLIFTDSVRVRAAPAESR